MYALRPFATSGRPGWLCAAGPPRCRDAEGRQRQRNGPRRTSRRSARGCGWSSWREDAAFGSFRKPLDRPAPNGSFLGADLLLSFQTGHTARGGITAEKSHSKLISAVIQTLAVFHHSGPGCLTSRGTGFGGAWDAIGWRKGFGQAVGHEHEQLRHLLFQHTIQGRTSCVPSAACFLKRCPLNMYSTVRIFTGVL